MNLEVSLPCYMYQFSSNLHCYIPDGENRKKLFIRNISFISSVAGFYDGSGICVLVCVVKDACFLQGLVSDTEHNFAIGSVIILCAENEDGLWDSLLSGIWSAQAVELQHCCCSIGMCSIIITLSNEARYFTY